MTVIIRWKFLSILCFFLLVFIAAQGFVAGDVHAGAGSITINNISLTMQTDANSNGMVNVGDVIRVELNVNNTDGGCNGPGGTTATVDMTKYGGGASEAFTCQTDNGGTADVLVMESFWVADAGIDGIDVGSADAASQVTVTASDMDDTPGPSANSNSMAQPVDTIAPVVDTAAISVSGATGTGGVFISGDTPILRWDSSLETDTIVSTTMDGSQFRSTDGSLEAFPDGAVYQAFLTGALDVQNDTGKNITVTVVDDAGNSTTTTGTNDYVINTTLPQIVQIQALFQTGDIGVDAEPLAIANNWYYYDGLQNIRFKVSTDRALSAAKACVKPLSDDDRSSTCSFIGPDNDYEVGTVGVDYVNATNDLGMNGLGYYDYEFVIPLADYGLPTLPGGYPVNLYLVDELGNVKYSASQAEAFGAVFGINPQDTAPLDNVATTDWSAINDFTSVGPLVFSAEVGGTELGRITLNGPLNLTAQATIDALMNLATYVTVSGDVIRIDSAGLAAFDGGASLLMHVETGGVQPGLVVKDNAGTVQGYVSNTTCLADTGPCDPIELGGDMLDNFGWDALNGNLTFTTSGFSEFDTDFTAPTLIAARITSSNTVRLVFSEPVNGLAADFTDLRITGEEVAREISDMGGSGTEVINLTFAGDPVAPGTTATIDVNNPPLSVTDIVGNELALTDDFEVVDGQVSLETVYVDDDYSVSDAGGHDWQFDAFDNIADAVGAVAEGGTLDINGGAYTTSSQINLDKALTLDGPGIGSLDPATITNDSCGYVLNITTADVTVQGLFIREMNGTEGYCNSYPSIRISGSDVTGVTITGNDIAGGYRGVQINNTASSNVISDNLVHDAYTGIAVSGSVNNTISGNEVYDNTNEGILFRAGSCSGDGCAYDMDGNVVRDNDIHDNPTGIQFESDMGASGGAEVEIASNTIDSNSCYGIYIGNYVYGVTMSGNDITDNGQACEDTGIYTDSVDSIVIHSNTISGNDDGIINNAGAETPLDATRNYWGNAAGPYNGTTNPESGGDSVSDDVTYQPYYTDAARTMLSDTTEIPVSDLEPVELEVEEGDDDASLDVSALLTDLEGEIPEITINATTSVGVVTVEIPAGTTVTGEAGWTGIIHAPTVKPNDSVTVTEGTVARVIEIGFDDIALTFDQGVRILIAGQGDKSVGYSRDGVFTEITDACAFDDQVIGDALDPGADCKKTVGSDMVVWTKHFTSFVSYTDTSTGGGGGSGSSGITTVSQPPSGISISIDGGAATTPDADVTLSLAASNAHSMRVSNRSDLSDASWEPYAATKSWTLAGSAPGTYTVYAVFRSSNGIETASVNDTIGLITAGAATEAAVQPNVVEMPSGRPEPVDFGYSIDADKGLLGIETALTSFCDANELIKLPNDGNPETQYDTAVYYCGHDGKRYVFPNDKLYFTWYRSFSGITIIGPEFMASLPLGKNVTYRPTSRMIKIQSEPNTYVIEPGGVLRLVPDQETAMATFGPSWNTLIDDIDVAFFTDYTVGAPMPSLR